MNLSHKRFKPYLEASKPIQKLSEISEKSESLHFTHCFCLGKVSKRLGLWLDKGYLKPDDIEEL